MLEGAHPSHDLASPSIVLRCPTPKTSGLPRARHRTPTSSPPTRPHRSSPTSSGESAPTTPTPPKFRSAGSAASSPAHAQEPKAPAEFAGSFSSHATGRPLAGTTAAALDGERGAHDFAHSHRRHNRPRTGVLRVSCAPICAAVLAAGRGLCLSSAELPLQIGGIDAGAAWRAAGVSKANGAHQWALLLFGRCDKFPIDSIQHQLGATEHLEALVLVHVAPSQV